MKGCRNLNVVVGSKYAIKVETLRNPSRYVGCFFFHSAAVVSTAFRIDW